MPDLIVPPAENANSYATLDDSNAYHETHLYADAWYTATVDSQQRSLIMATRLIDAVYARTHGAWPVRTEPLQWQKDATAELARQLLESNRTADNDVAKQGITRLKAGPVDIEFDLKAISTANRVESVIPDAVRLLMDPAWYTPVLDIDFEVLK